MWRPPSDPTLLDAAVRAGAPQYPRLVARRGGVDLLVADSRRVLGGQVVDSPGDGGVRRNLELELEDVTGELEETLAPAGTTLHPYQVVTLTDGTEIPVPMGVFDVDVQKASIGPHGGLSLTCPDKYARIQRAGFIRPVQPRAGMVATQQIADLVRGALGADEPVLISARSQLPVSPNLVFDEDRARAIEDLAKAAAVHVGFDRLGRCEIRDLPTLTGGPEWLVDASPAGVLLDGDRERSRRRTRNVVVASGERPDDYGPGFDPVVVWDSDPASPTYAGPDPVNRPELAGPFGVAVYRYHSPLLTDAHAAERAALAILARVTGIASQLSVSAVAHPGLDAFDTVEALPPRRRPGQALVRERHLADAVTHPLKPGAVQQITGRSTRADEYGS